MIEPIPVEVTVNDVTYTRDVDPRMTVADFLREEIGLTGTHVGCEHGACGACTILVDGASSRSCIMYAPQVNGATIVTIEGISGTEGQTLHPVQRAMKDCHGLQCGFCTPGMVLTAIELLSENGEPTDDQIRSALTGNICRCTGYESIVDAVRLAASRELPSLRTTPDSGIRGG